MSSFQSSFGWHGSLPATSSGLADSAVGEPHSSQLLRGSIRALTRKSVQSRSLSADLFVAMQQTPRRDLPDDERDLIDLESRSEHFSDWSIVPSAKVKPADKPLPCPEFPQSPRMALHSLFTSVAESAAPTSVPQVLYT